MTGAGHQEEELLGRVLAHAPDTGTIKLLTELALFAQGIRLEVAQAIPPFGQLADDAAALPRLETDGDLVVAGVNGIVEAGYVAVAFVVAVLEVVLLAGDVRAVGLGGAVAQFGHPQPHLFEVIGAMSQNPALSNDFTDNFTDPARQLEHMASPEATAAYVTSFAELTTA